MGKELGKDYYDEAFKNGGHNKLYFKEAKEIKEYYPSWKMSYEYIKNNNINKITDLGCGPGHFPSLFSEDNHIIYEGYDFSEIAINQAIKKMENKPNFKFFIEDLKNIEFKEDQKFFVSFEFLEHISFDVEILNKLKKGSEIIFSVPNYDSAGHVRFYKDEKEIEDRYGTILDLKKMGTFLSGKNKCIFLYNGIKK